MTRIEPRPRRTPTRHIGDHIRRASLADAASGVDPYAPLDWLTGSGVNAAEARRMWADSKLIDVPASRAFDVVRMPLTPGWDTIRHLRTMGAAVGPILHTHLGVEALVPVGSANDWDLPEAHVLQAGEVVSVPHPSVVAPHTVHARAWVIAPREGALLTDGADLYGAYAAALISVGRSVGAVS